MSGFKNSFLNYKRHPALLKHHHLRWGMIDRMKVKRGTEDDDHETKESDDEDDDDEWTHWETINHFGLNGWKFIQVLLITITIRWGSSWHLLNYDIIFIWHHHLMWFIIILANLVCVVSENLWLPLNFNVLLQKWNEIIKIFMNISSLISKDSQQVGVVCVSMETNNNKELRDVEGLKFYILLLAPFYQHIIATLWPIFESFVMDEARCTWSIFEFFGVVIFLFFFLYCEV